MIPVEDKRTDESLGAYFARVREAHSLTVEKLSAETKISVPHITAIEKSDWKAFPVEAYLRSYLNSLCSKLGLDTKKVMGWYTKESGSQYMNVSLDTAITSTISPMAEENVKKHSKAIPIVIILLGLGFLAAMHFMDQLGRFDESGDAAKSDSAVVEESENVTPSEIPEGAEAVPADSLRADSIAAAKKDSAERNGSVSQAVVDEAIKKSDRPASATIFISSTSKKDEKVEPAPNNGNTRLELIGSGTARTWIGLKHHDEDDTFLKESNISIAGTKMVYNTKDTILVIIGEPRAISKMILNGVETPLPEMQFGRVTRFRVFDGKVFVKGN
jgi:cytoskeletal protein RodZ